MFITESVWNELKIIENSYKNLREARALERGDVQGHKVAYQSILLARVYKLNENNTYTVESERERYGCAYLYTMLNNGWTVGDMEYFLRFNEFVEGIQDEKLRAVGIKLINELSETKIDTVDMRYELLNKCGGFLATCGKMKGVDEVRTHLNSSLGANLNYSEYMNDKEFINSFDKEGKFNPHRLINKGRPIEEYESLYTSAIRHSKLTTEEKQLIRNREHYVIKEKTDTELEQFNLTEGHKEHKITKSTRNAIKEVFGEELYDDIDEMSKGDETERAVRMHHALGNKFLRKGEEVLELDYAGSGYKEVRKEYRGQHGKMFTDGTRSSDDSIKAEFGELVQRGKTTYKYLRSKKSEVEVNGKKMEKTRYTIAGPSPENKGFWNFGEYSIENTRSYGRRFSAEFLTKIFEKWNSKEEIPHDVHINITGHSRGAVAAGECARLVNKWMRDYEKKNKDIQDVGEYKNKVKFDILLRDPVPGIITNWRFGYQDFRKIPNANVTVFCSVAQEHADLAFPLQNIRGQKRLIIGVTGHDMDLGNIDFSQRLHADDGLTHKEGFYDAETGEMFRGSGVAEMPEGVYIADDRFNMIRITSFSQVSKLVEAIYGGNSKQSRRVSTIYDMARNWFVDNNLKTSFADEEAYEDACIKNNQVEEKILATTNSRISPIKEAIRELRRMKQRGDSPSEIVKVQNDIIRLGKKYMEKTKLPNSGDSQYRMDLVSDVVTFMMREKNYLTRKYNLDNGKDKEGRALDEKIRNHKKRLEEKPGALERKYEKEKKRLEKDKNALDIVKSIKGYCEDADKVLSETKKNKAQNKEYKDFINTIKEGKTLSGNASVNQIKEYIQKLNRVSLEYSKWNSSPKTDEGKIRTSYANGFVEMSENAYFSFDKATNFIGDKNQSLNTVISKRESRLKELSNKLPKKNQKDGLKEETVDKKPEKAFTDKNPMVK